MIRYFKMLSGYCHVLEDRLVFLPSPDLAVFKEDPALTKLQTRMAKIRGILYPIFIFFTLIGFYFTIYFILEGETVVSLLFLGMGIILLRILMIYLLSNPILMIKKENIISIKYQKEITLLGIWPMFVVKFTKSNGKIGRKLIVLKYTLSEYGKEIADHAMQLFQEEDYYISK